VQDTEIDDSRAGACSSVGVCCVCMGEHVVMVVVGVGVGWQGAGGQVAQCRHVACSGGVCVRGVAHCAVAATGSGVGH
jgi:hypothetical protein